MRWLRLPLAVLVGLGLSAAPADAQLWKPTKKKPAAGATKAKSAPAASRKVRKPTKRKARPKARKRTRRPAPIVDDAPKVTSDDTPEFDDAPVIVILPGDPDE